jgi:hypothetical protein
MSRIAMALMSLALIAFAAACGGDDEPVSDAATATPIASSPTTRPEASATPDATSTPDDATGVDSIDAIAQAVRKDGVRGLADLVLYRQVACTTTAEGIGGPPECLEGEGEGTEVLAVFAASCEGYHARESDLLFSNIELASPALYGAFRVEASSPLRGPWADATYAIILNRTLPGGGTGVFALFADDEGIVGFSTGCGETPELYVETQGLADAIIAPH